jgi:hypothetical protein
MEHHTSHVTDDLLTWVKTFTLDLPLTGTQWAFGIEKKEAVTASAWHGYDAGMRVLTNMIDTLYRLPLSGVVLDRTASTLLRWQHMRTAVTDAAFSGLWPTVGLPTTTEMRTLAETVAGLVRASHEQRGAQGIPLPLATQITPAAKTTEQPHLVQPRFGGPIANQRHVSHAVPRLAHSQRH